MPKHEPIREAAMLGSYSIYTTCEVLRELYREAQKLPESREKQQIMLKARLAMTMAKVVTSRLYKYEPDYMNLFDKTGDVSK